MRRIKNDIELFMDIYGYKNLMMLADAGKPLPLRDVIRIKEEEKDKKRKFLSKK